VLGELDKERAQAATATYSSHKISDTAPGYREQ
jgi:hypothetical protein